LSHTPSRRSRAATIDQRTLARNGHRAPGRRRPGDPAGPAPRGPARVGGAEGGERGVAATVGSHLARPVGEAAAFPRAGSTARSRGRRRPAPALCHRDRGAAGRPDASVRYGLGLPSFGLRRVLDCRIRCRTRDYSPRAGGRHGPRDPWAGASSGRGQHPAGEHGEPSGGREAGLSRRGCATALSAHRRRVA